VHSSSNQNGTANLSKGDRGPPTLGKKSAPPQRWPGTPPRAQTRRCSLPGFRDRYRGTVLATGPPLQPLAAGRLGRLQPERSTSRPRLASGNLPPSPATLVKAVLADLGAAGHGQEAFRVHLQLVQQSGAGAWLHAPTAENLGLPALTCGVRGRRLPALRWGCRQDG